MIAVLFLQQALSCPNIQQFLISPTRDVVKFRPRNRASQVKIFLRAVADEDFPIEHAITFIGDNRTQEIDRSKLQFEDSGISYPASEESAELQFHTFEKPKFKEPGNYIVSIRVPGCPSSYHESTFCFMQKPNITEFSFVHDYVTPYEVAKFVAKIEYKNVPVFAKYWGAIVKSDEKDDFDINNDEEGLYINDREMDNDAQGVPLPVNKIITYNYPVQPLNKTIEPYIIETDAFDQPFTVGDYTFIFAIRDYPLRDITENEYHIRNRKEIDFIDPGVSFLPGDRIQLDFKLNETADPDTVYDVYVNDNRTSVPNPTGPFKINFTIPDDAPVGEYKFNYSVSIGGWINSTNHIGTLYIRSKPILSVISTDRKHYTKEDSSFKISFNCRDEDQEDEFQILVKIGNEGDFTAIGQNVTRTGLNTPINLVINNDDKFQLGTTNIQIKVTDKYGKTSDTHDIPILIVEKPSVTVTEQTPKPFYEPGNTLTLNLVLADHDQDEVIKVSYKFDDGEATQLEAINIDNTNHQATKQLTVTIPSNIVSNKTKLVFSVTDKYLLSAEATLDLEIHHMPSATILGSPSFVPGRKNTFEVTVEDKDMPYDTIKYEYKLGAMTEFKQPEVDEEEPIEVNGLRSVRSNEANNKHRFLIDVASNEPAGSSTLTLKVTDKWSLTSTTQKQVTIKAHPMIDVVEAFTSVNYIAGSTFFINGTAHDADGDISTVHLESDIKKDNIPDVAVNAPFSFTFTVPQNQKPGPIKIGLYNVDSDGLFSEPKNYTINVRASPKFGSCTFDKQVYNAGDDFTITCDVTDEDDDDTVKYGAIEDDGQFKESGTVTTDHETHTKPVTFGPYTIPQDYQEPSISKTLVIKDKYDFTTNKTIQINLKSRPEIVSAKSDKPYYFRGDNVVISGKIKDDDNTDTVTVTLDATHESKQIETTKGVEKDFEFSFKVPEHQDLGDMTVTISAQDSSNIKAEDKSVTFKVYFVPILTAHPNSTIFLPGANASITVEVEEQEQGNPVDLKYKYDGMDGFKNLSTVSEFKNNKSTNSYDIELPTKPFSGILNVTFFGVDSHGIPTENKTVGIEIRNKPVIKAEFVNDQNTTLRDNNLTIDLNIEDFDDDELFNITIDGKVIKQLDKKGNSSISVLPTSQELGEHEMVVTVVDKYGFGSEPITLKYAIRAKPVIKFLSESQGRHVRGENISIEYQISDEDESDHSTLAGKLGDKSLSIEEVIATTSSPSTKNLNVSIPDDEPYGDRTVELIATDKYGFKSEPTTTKFNIVRPIAFKLDNDDVYPKQGDNITVKFEINEPNGDNNLTLIISNITILSDGNTTENNGTFRNSTIVCTIENGKSKCDDMNDFFKYTIPNDLPDDSVIKFTGTLIDSFGQVAKSEVEIKAKNFPPELVVINKSQVVLQKNKPVVIPVNLSDLNPHDTAKIFVQLEDENKTTIFEVPYDTTPEGVIELINFSLPNGTDIGDQLNFSIFAKDKNGKESNKTYFSLNVTDPNAGGVPGYILGGDDKGFLTLLENRAFIIILIAALIIITLIIILILLIYPLIRKENESEETTPIIMARDIELPSHEDSGETTSVSTIDWSEGEPGEVELPSRDDSGETVSVSTIDWSEGQPGAAAAAAPAPVAAFDDDQTDSNSGETFVVDSDDVDENEIN